MKICAMTMVYQDYWALAQWIRHYSKHLGIENLFVVAHGHDPKVNEIAKGANIWTIPRETMDMFDKRRNDMLSSFQGGLLQYFDWVIRVDTDELICLDPSVHDTFADLLGNTKEAAIFSLGLNVFECVEDDVMADGVPVFQSRSAAVITGNYSKAWAVSVNTPLMRHGVKLTTGDKTLQYDFPKGVYLTHLKFANIQALSEVNLARHEVATSGARRVPGWGWKRSDQHAMKFFKSVESIKWTNWDDALKLAWDTIPANMKFDEADGVIRSPGIPYLAKVRLPDWFKTY